MGADTSISILENLKKTRHSYCTTHKISKYMDTPTTILYILSVGQQEGYSIYKNLDSTASFRRRHHTNWLLILEK